ncbi:MULTISPECIES: PspA/IM30 family protein [Oceanobacillus]|uniref:PspA/IM30 family protein n=1 Tax=Oceanobacillus TaxID=182709 RepID=UPI000B004C15
MFQLYNRMKTIVSSELNTMTDKAEDPVKMLEQYPIDIGKEIQNNEELSKKALKDKRHREKSYESLQASWEHADEVA